MQVVSGDRAEEIPIGDDILSIMPLGAGQEVGRSCIVLKYRGHTVMFDCGIHPGYMETAGLPFFDAIDPESVDMLLVTHFHIDHCAAVPWFLNQTAFKGKCYMTHVTKQIFKMLLQDYVRVAQGHSDQSLFNKVDLDNCLPKISEASYHQTITYNGIKVMCFNAGHVGGACMWLVEIDGVKVLYTGDFSLEKERELNGAEIPNISPDVLIIESTHGINRNKSRIEREYLFTSDVRKIVERGGRCLVPIFALGRVDELLMILEEYWSMYEELQRIPIYFGSNLTKKSMGVYNNFKSGMSDTPGGSSRNFKYIKFVKKTEEIDDSSPCVVMASPAMLQNGMSRTLFDRWAPDPLNGVIIPGYTVDNTLAKQLLNEPKEIIGLNGQTIPRKCSISSISFSGHADFTQTSKFIESLKTKKVVLVHGVASEMDKLRGALMKEFSYFDIEVYTPGDCEATNFVFKSNPTASVNGSLLETSMDTLSGLIVRKDGFSHTIVSAEELSSHSVIQTLRVDMKQRVKTTRKLSTFTKYLKRHFKDVNYVSGMITIGQYINLKEDGGYVVIAWTSNPMSDMIADSIAMMLTVIDPEQDDGMDDMFAAKLQLAMQCRWGSHIQFDPDMEMFNFNVNDKSVAIAMNPDSANGIEILECDDEDLKNAINKLALKLFEMSKAVELPSI